MEAVFRNVSWNVISEELNGKIKQSAYLKRKIKSIYYEIRRSFSLLRYTCVLRTMVSLTKKYHQDVINTHTKRILRFEMDVDQLILNLSSYDLFFFQKLVLCRGLKFAIPQGVSALKP